MTFRRFFIQGLLISLLITAAFAGLNYFRDDFGLFRHVENRKIRIYTSERVSKYLLSLRYIPANYDGVIVGPSLSDELDPAKIHGYRIYNLSIAGGNISQIRLCTENVIRNGSPKLLIICLDPYLTRETGLNDRRLNPRMYWSVLGSTFSFQYFWDRFEKTWSKKIDGFADSWNGKRDLAKINMNKNLDPEKAIKDFARVVERGKPDLTVSNEVLAEFRALLEKARSSNVQVVAFFYPQPYLVFKAEEVQYRGFQEQVRTLFSRNDTVYDFNGDEYLAFRQDYTNYSDHGHLSVKGADFIVGELDRKLSTIIPGHVSGRPAGLR